MPEPQNQKSRVAPAILIAVSAVVLLIGVGRCGFLQPMIHPRMDDYGFGGACCLVVGLTLLIVGFIWFTDRRKKRL